MRAALVRLALLLPWLLQSGCVAAAAGYGHFTTRLLSSEHIAIDRERAKIFPVHVKRVSTRAEVVSAWGEPDAETETASGCSILHYKSTHWTYAYAVVAV